MRGRALPRVTLGEALLSFSQRKEVALRSKGGLRILLTVGLSAAVAFTTKSLSKFVCKMDKCYPQFSSTALCFV